jgi:peptidoglycan hydrolase-like protein with peptidoglycan-binding domain
MSEQRTKIRRAGLAVLTALGLIAGGGLSNAMAAPQVGEAPSVPGSPPAITFTGASTGAAPAPMEAAPVVPVPMPAPAPRPAAAPAPAPPAGGPLELEQHLAHLHYDVGAIDGTVDAVTNSAVMAFQKVHGMERTGEVTPELISAVLATKDTPPPLVPGGGVNRVEVDLARQVLFLYEGDTLSRILPVSSGNGERFCEGGRCRNAITPTGDFNVYRQGQGWEEGPLGSLYNPQYFKGGVAIHGARSVPAEPASHGCVRIPMSAAEWFPSHVSIGTPVFVR